MTHKKLYWFVLTLCLGGLAAGILTWPSPTPAQNYRPVAGDSRRAVTLRGELMVGQGPSTINMMNARAYSTGMGDLPRTTQAPGGALSSAMSGSSSYSIQRSGVGGSALGTMTPSGQTQSRQVYNPVQPVRITSAGAAASSGRASVGSLMADSPEPSPGMESADALTGGGSAQKASAAVEPARPTNLPTGRITSLVPKVAWEYKDPMAAGEKAFREGNYPEALAQFEKARQISHNCPESLLALTHVSLATAKDSYEDSARYLAATIEK